MTPDRRTESSKYWLRRRAAALSVLANPVGTTLQRHSARCRLNRAVDVLGRLEPVPAMKHGLDVDKERRVLA